MRIVIFLLSLLMLGGCAKPDYNYQPLTVELSEPPIEDVSKAYVGERMLEQGKYKKHMAIYVEDKIDVGWAYDLMPGYYLKQGEDEDTETYHPGKGNDGGSIQKAALADPWSAVMIYKEKNKICVVTVFNALQCEKTSQFERSAKPIFTKNSFQRTLIYNGKIGDKVNIGYREFSNNLARPAFSNNVEYDLSSS